MSVPQTTSRYQLRVNAYDRVSSLLVSVLVITGFTVAGLIIVYVARQLIDTQRAVPFQPVNPAGRPADAAMGLARDLEPPGIEEVPDLIEPQLQDTLSAVASAVAARTALLSDEDIDSQLETGHGRGLGDNRRAGSGTGSGPDEPTREIRFQPASLRQYAQWLDSLHIELGVLGHDNRVHYAYNLSRDKPSVRMGGADPAQDQRMFMNSAETSFAALDRQLTAKAGIADKGDIILQFFPPDTEAILLGLEQKHAGERKPDEIRHTVFRVTPVGDRFQLSVEQQSYR
ncbi:MAG TPA: hypothetical protein VJ828_20195 [Lacipirellulaceae bacterium]|nr:hypothetical protein [Lacipirellulaceae bacterium]